MSTTTDKPPRPIAGPWIHRTATRTWYGPLEDVTAGPLQTSVNFPWLKRTLHVLRVLTVHDFRGRYRAQALGVVWSLANPLVMMTIISVVFTRAFHSTTPNFPIFVLIGLLVWQWISTAVSAGTQAFVANADLVKRTVFAREALPMASVLSYGINFALESVVLLVFVPIFPEAFRLSPALLSVPPLLVVLVLLLAGVTLCTSVLHVIYRDVAFAVSTGLSILYWLTGVFYPMEVIPRPYLSVLEWNPVAAVLAALREAVMSGRWPSGAMWLHAVVPTVVVAGLGWWIFQRYERMALDHV